MGQMHGREHIHRWGACTEGGSTEGVHALRRMQGGGTCMEGAHEMHAGGIREMQGGGTCRGRGTCTEGKGNLVNIKCMHRDTIPIATLGALEQMS